MSHHKFTQKQNSQKMTIFKRFQKILRFRLEEYSKLASSAENTLLSILRQQTFLTHQIKGTVIIQT